MDFDQLNSFLEVARHNSFSRAAEKCYRTQPAISAQIRALEEEVGAKLFDRSGGKVALTGAGKAFLKFAEGTLEARRNIISSVAEMERIPRGEIIVSANEATCLHVLPEVFAEFKKQYSTVAVSIHRSERQRILEMVIDNYVDFGVISMPITDTRLSITIIHRDELVIITPPNHPLARKERVAIAEVARFPLLLPQAGNTRDAIEQLLFARDLKIQVSMELDSSELLKRFVAADLGIAFIARSNVAEDLKAGSLVALPISDALIKRDLALIHRKDKALSRAALAFIEIAVKTKAQQVAQAR